MKKPGRGKSNKSRSTPVKKRSKPQSKTPQASDLATIFAAEGTRFVRVELHEAPPPNEDPSAPIFIDLAVDGERKAGKWLVFGWRGTPGRRDVDCFPFVIDQHGRMDFGSEWEFDGDRYGQTDLFDKTIKLGELVRFDVGGEGRFDYRIVHIYDLANPSTST